MAELDLWSDTGGARARRWRVEVKGFAQDTAEDRGAAHSEGPAVCPPEKLTVNPDCGSAGHARYMCNQKLSGLAGGAALVRRELTGKR